MKNINKYVIQYYKNPLRTTTIVVSENKLVKTLRDIFNKGGYNVRICAKKEPSNYGLKGNIYIDEFFDWENEMLNG